MWTDSNTGRASASQCTRLISSHLQSDGCGGVFPHAHHQYCSYRYPRGFGCLVQIERGWQLENVLLVPLVPSESGTILTVDGRRTTLFATGITSHEELSDGLALLVEVSSPHEDPDSRGTATTTASSSPGSQALASVVRVQLVAPCHAQKLSRDSGSDGGKL